MTPSERYHDIEDSSPARRIMEEKYYKLLQRNAELAHAWWHGHCKHCLLDRRDHVDLKCPFAPTEYEETPYE